MTKVVITKKKISHVELVQIVTTQTPEQTTIIYGTTPPRFTIVAPDDYNFPPPRVASRDQLAHI